MAGASRSRRRNGVESGKEARAPVPSKRAEGRTETCVRICVSTNFFAFAFVVAVVRAGGRKSRRRKGAESAKKVRVLAGHAGAEGRTGTCVRICVCTNFLCLCLWLLSCVQADAKAAAVQVPNPQKKPVSLLATQAQKKVRPETCARICFCVNFSCLCLWLMPCVQAGAKAEVAMALNPPNKRALPPGSSAMKVTF